MGSNEDKYVLIGLGAGGLLLAFYFIVVSLLGGFYFALQNFINLWYWMIPLVVGFGIQMGMFFYIKDEVHKKATAEATASCGMSAGSMVACCVHHIADIAPFLGIAALGVFFTKYQSTFLLMGITSNVLGMTYMAGLINTKISKTKIKAIFYSLLALSVLIVSASFAYNSNIKNIITEDKNAQKFQTLTSNENDVEFQVTPSSASEFQVAINTHSVDLGFDPAQISVLYDNLGNIYKPLKWEGSPQGGHHRNGILKFSAINKDAKSIKLVITDSAKREFKWDIK